MVTPMGFPQKQRVLKAEDGNIIYLSDYIWATKYSPSRDDDLYLHALMTFGWQNNQLKLRVKNEEALKKVAQGLEDSRQEKEEASNDPGDQPPTGGPNRAA